MWLCTCSKTKIHPLISENVPVYHRSTLHRQNRRRLSLVPVPGIPIHNLPATYFTEPCATATMRASKSPVQVAITTCAIVLGALRGCPRRRRSWSLAMDAQEVVPLGCAGVREAAFPSVPLRWSATAWSSHLPGQVPRGTPLGPEHVDVDTTKLRGGTARWLQKTTNIVLCVCRYSVYLLLSYFGKNMVVKKPPLVFFPNSGMETSITVSNL